MVPEEEMFWLIVNKPSVESDKSITTTIIAKKAWVDSLFKKKEFHKKKRSNVLNYANYLIVCWRQAYNTIIDCL